MPLYYFSVRNGSGNLFDADGIELPDIEAVREYAVGLARELMFGNEVGKRHWSLCAHDAERREVFALPFVAVDDSIRHFPPQTKRLIEQNSKSKLALAEAIFSAKMGVLRVRATIARSRSRPYIAAYKGNSVVG